MVGEEDFHKPKKKIIPKQMKVKKIIIFFGSGFKN